jgi:PAS domain S-box-containing protein
MHIMVDQTAEEPLVAPEPDRNTVEDHIALIFDEDEERLTTITPLIKVGLEKGELCLYVSNEENDLAVVEALKAEHIDVDKAISNGSLIITSKKEMYFKLGRFDPEWTIRVINNIADLARSYGFTAMRVMSEMAWTQEKVPGVERWPEYEAKMNTLSPGISLRIICQYDRRVFSPEALMAAIQTHPRIVADGQINKNCFYIPSDRLLNGNYAEAELERVLSSIRQINSSEAALQDRDSTIKSLGRQADADNTARKGLEMALEESRRRFKDLAERASDWAWELDEQGNYIYSSPRIKDILGLQPEDVIGKTPLDLVSKEAAERTAKLLTRAMASHAPISALEKEARHKDGHIVYLEMNGTPHFDHDGKFLGYRGVDRDISGRRASKLAIEESRKRAEESLVEIRARDERIAALDGEMTRLKGSLAELDSSIAALRGDIDGKQAELNEAVEGLERLNESLRTREAELVSLKSAHEEKVSQVGAQAEEIADLKRQLNDKGGELTGIQATLAAAQMALHGKVSELEQLTSSFNAQSLEIKGARESLSGVEETLAHKEQEHFAMRQQIERLEADLIAAKDSLTARNDELSRAQLELSETRASLEQRSSELTAANESLAQKVKDLAAADELVEQRARELAAANETIELKVGELAKASSSLEQRMAELAIANELAVRREAEIEEAKSSMERTRTELATAKGSLESTISELAAANHGLDQKAVEIASARELIEQRRIELESANASLEQKTSELAAASELAEQRAKDLAAADERLAQLTAELASLKEAVEKKDAELAATGASLERRTSELAAANELVEGKVAEISAANELQEQKAAALASAEAKIAEKEAVVAEAIAAIESLKSLLASRESDLEARTADRDARIEEIRSLQEEKVRLESALSSKGTELAEAVASYEGAKADIAALTEELQLAREDLGRSQKESAELVATISARDAALAVLGSTADRTASDLAARDAELSSARSLLSERERDLAQLTSRTEMLSKVLTLKEEELSSALVSSEARRNSASELDSRAKQLESDRNVNATVIDGLRAAMAERQKRLDQAADELESSATRARALVADKEKLAAERMSEIVSLNAKLRDLEAARNAASSEAERMRQIFMGLPTPAAMVSPEGMVLVANPVLEKVMATTGLVGRSAGDMWPGLNISEPGPIRVSLNGQDMEMAVRPSALGDGMQDIGTVLTFGDPVPVRTTVESKGPSPEMLAHDLNDSLQVIMGSVSLAKEYVIPEGRMYSKLRQIESASVTARELAGKLMSPAREVHLTDPSTPTNLTRGKGRLLLMDDDENVLEATGDLLRYLGYSVEVARDGEEAVAMCKEAEEIWQSYDLAMVDLSISSGMGGMEASRRLVGMNPEMVLIVTSGYLSDPVIADPGAHGFAAALPKPYSAELLSKTIAEVLAKRSA